MKTKIAFILSATILIVIQFSACNKEKEAEGIDRELFDMAKETSGFTWYKNSDENLEQSSGSGHPQPFLRTRYNSIASNLLDANGKVEENAIFPEGSLIVKELINSSNEIDLYAVLYKSSDSEAANSNGWVWGYVNADGTVREPSSNRGSACISCHLQAGNIDYMLMNLYFP